MQILYYHIILRQGMKQSQGHNSAKRLYNCRKSKWNGIGEVLTSEDTCKLAGKGRINATCRQESVALGKRVRPQAGKCGLWKVLWEDLFNALRVLWVSTYDFIISWKGLVVVSSYSREDLQAVKLPVTPIFLDSFIRWKSIIAPPYQAQGCTRAYHM